MKTLYLDCTTGAAGDMIMSALLGLFDDPKFMLQRLNDIGIPNVEIRLNNAEKCGISGLHVSVLAGGKEEDDVINHKHGHHEYHHEHHEHHGHHHSHTGIKEIYGIIDGLNISEKVKYDAKAVYDLLARAESEAHNTEIENIHFHEVGTMDAIADIVCVSCLIEELKLDKIYTSKVDAGSGKVKCAHGVLPVPAPATAYLLRGVPTFLGHNGSVGELCTPTGAALLSYFTDEFDPACDFNIQKIGYGFGTRHYFDAEGNEEFSAVRAMLCAGKSEHGDTVCELTCEMDDITGEEIGYAVEKILDAGALDVYTTSVYMKKNRPGVLLSVICKPDDKLKLVRLIFKHTTTIGIRENYMRRHILKREIKSVDSIYGKVDCKISSGYGTEKSKMEFESVKKMADDNDIPIETIKRMITYDFIDRDENEMK